MGDWYVVIKRIKGRAYRYRQKTWREGSRVRTQSQYLGPASDADVAAAGAPVSKRGGVSRARVAEVIQRLSDPSQAAAVWTAPWDEDGKRHGRKHRIAELDRAAMVRELAAEGGSVEEIAAMMQMGEVTVRKILTDAEKPDSDQASATASTKAS